ncbi:MAG: hypothetical protein ACOVP4_03160 [Bacteriovoracaceae bacterium]
MVQLILRFLFLLMVCPMMGLSAKDPFFDKATLGEKDIDLFWKGHFPEVKQNSSNGKLFFVDDEVEQKKFYFTGFNQAPYFLDFLYSELDAGMTCPNDLLGPNFDYIRYGYRLMSLSLLIEDYWHLQALSSQFKWKNSCEVPLSKILSKCAPKSNDMINAVNLWRKHLVKNPEKFHPDFNYSQWMKERTSKKQLSHYRTDDLCARSPKFCASQEESFNHMCQTDSKDIELLCSEIDQVYGATSTPQIFYGISRSNFINTFNKEGLGVGCLRRFSQMMVAHEGEIPSLKVISLALPGHLQSLYGDRFPQGRPFIYGSLKEFANKGLTEIFETTTPEPKEEVAKAEVQVSAPKVETKKAAPAPVVVAAPVVKKEFKEIQGPMKSAFLQAAEVRESQNLERVDVDMLKFKYDYVFSLNMIQKLNSTLKTYMGRDALVEMSTYDKLGTKDGPVPLLFIKFMLDMQEHQGIYNLMAVLGERFYVSNEIDSEFKTKPELIEVRNDDSTNRQWQLTILRP